MYRNNEVSVDERYKELDSLINEEKMKDVIDTQRLIKLEESKMLNIALNNNMNGTYGRYRLPW